MVRRAGLGGRIIGSPVVVSGLTIYGLITVFVASGGDARMFLLATLGLLCALAMDRLLRRRLAFGLVSLVVGFALAASLLQFPYAQKYKHAG